MKKLLLNLFEKKLGPHFHEGGRLHKYWPAYDAFYTFLFLPAEKSQEGVHVHDAMNLKRLMSMVIIAMLPPFLFGMYNTGYQHFLALGQPADFWQCINYGALKVLPIVVVSYVVGLGIEFAFCIIKGHPVSEGYLVSGLLIPLVLPADIPLWMVALAVAFAVIFAKEVFGGTGMNILNVALTARAFLFFAYPSYMSGNIWVSGVPAEVNARSGATLLAQAADINFAGHFRAVNGVGYDNTFLSAFIGLIPGSIGETSTLACLIGGAILIWTGVGSWRIILSVFAGAYLTALLYNFLGLNAYMRLPAHYHLVMGGLAFGAVYMATDPVSAAQTNKGKFIYGFLIGMMAVMIRVVNPAYPEGVMLAILLLNVLAPVIDYFVVQGNIRRRLKRYKTVAHAQ